MALNIDKFKNIPYNKREYCVICEAGSERPTIELPRFPLTEIYTGDNLKECVGFLDQNFYFCKNCGHGQIGNVIDMDLLYGNQEAYHFRSSKSATGRNTADFFISFLSEIAKDRTFATAVEIGCNDLYILRSLRSIARKLIGIDPILKGKEKELSEGNIIAVGGFFEDIDLDDDIDLIICKDTLEHVAKPKQFVKKIVDASSDNALFLFQLPLLEALLEGCRFDQVFHQHLNYFSLQSIICMLSELGCTILDYKINTEHWGTILIAFEKKPKKPNPNVKFRKISVKDISERHKLFRDGMELTKKRLLFSKGQKMYGYGAALMLPALDYHLGGKLSCLECIIDDDREKEGLRYINLNVDIKTMDKIKDITDSIVLVTAISSIINVRSILRKLFEINPKQIIVPLDSI